MQDFCPIQDRKPISLSSSLFLPDFSSAYCLRLLLSLRSALQGSLPVAFDLYYLNQTEQNRIQWRLYRWIRHRTSFSITDFAILLIFIEHCIQKNVSMFLSFSRTFCDYQGDFLKIQGQFKDKLHFFRIPGVFQDQGHFQGLFNVCANPVSVPIITIPAPASLIKANQFINQPSTSEQ